MRGTIRSTEGTYVSSRMSAILRLRTELAELGELVRRDGDTRRVPRRNQGNGPSSFSDQRRSRIDARLLGAIGRKVDWTDADHLKPCVVIEVIGRLKNDLIASSGKCQGHDAKRVITSGGK